MNSLLPTVKFLITNSCNLRCMFCHNEFQGSVSPTSRTPFDTGRTVEVLSSIAPDRRFGDLKLSGGEPLTFVTNLWNVLNVADLFNFDRRILVSNLMAASPALLKELVSRGVTEVRVNIPSVDDIEYAKLTGTYSDSCRKVFRRVESAKRLGLRVRANVVVSDASCEDSQSRFFQGRVTELFDEVFFIVDYRCKAKEAVENRLIRLALKKGAVAANIRKGRIQELTLGGLKVSVARCTAPDSNEGRDYYLRAPGILMETFVAGFAYKQTSRIDRS